jgi:ubiquinone/menaquinone biosynthesis C-methylase UbiE
MKVLDAGTGTGYWAIKCAKKGSSVTGLDFSEELLHIAVAKARQADVEITWRHTALEEADLPANFFDIALSVTCLQHITERERQVEAVRRILQSLKTGGVFVLVEDTVVGGEPLVSDYMLTYPQHDWISLVESQGAQILKFIGVSFLRFAYARIPPQVSAALDFLIGYVRWCREHATVTAFAFIKEQSSFRLRGTSL